MTHRILVIGEDFGSIAVLPPEDRALTGASGRHLARLAGVPFRWYLGLTARRNVVPRKDDWRDRPHVEDRVAALQAIIPEHPRTLVLGRRAAAALGLAHVPWATWVLPERSPIAVIPHPSGRNLLYNDEDVRHSVSAFLRPVFVEARDRYRARHGR